MLRRIYVLAVLAVVGLSWLVAGAANAADSPAAATAWVPSQSVLVLQVNKPKALIDYMFQPKVKKAIALLPQYQAAIKNSETKEALNLLKFIENKYGSDLPTLLGRFAGKGITFAVSPDGTVLLIVEAEDVKLLNDLHELFLGIARNEAEKQGHPERVTSADYRGVTGWTFAKKEAHAIVGNRLLVSNKPDVLKSVIDLRDGLGGSSIADSAVFNKAMQAVDADSMVTAYADMSVLKHAPGLSKALSKNDNLLVRLLFAPIQVALREANWVSAGAKLSNNQFRVQVVSDGKPADAGSPDGFATLKTPSDGAMPNLDVPHRIAAASLYRDMHQFYAAKDELFPERTSGLIFFENMMGIFFTGRDLTEEVLAETLPDVRLVVTKQQFDANTGVPDVQFPGFALVVRLSDPDKFAPIAEEAWQKAIGLVNFTRGQKALPGLIIDRPVHDGTKYTVAYFSVADETDKTKVDSRFNFQPSLAVLGDYLILSSTGALTEDIMDALKKEKQAGIKPTAGAHSLVMLEGKHLASILEADFDALVRQNMIEKGSTRPEAEAAIRILVDIAKHIRSVDVAASCKTDRSDLIIDLGFELP